MRRVGVCVVPGAQVRARLREPARPVRPPRTRCSNPSPLRTSRSTPSLPAQPLRPGPPEADVPLHPSPNHLVRPALPSNQPFPPVSTLSAPNSALFPAVRPPRPLTPGIRRPTPSHLHRSPVPVLASVSIGAHFACPFGRRRRATSGREAAV